MARKKPSEEPAKPRKKKRGQIVLDPEIGRMVAAVIYDTDMTMSDYVNNKLAPVIRAEYDALQEQMGFERKQK